MYERFFKMTGKPFQLHPDPRFFFSSRTHKRALAYLRYGIEQQEGFIVITGDVGTGKTMLASRLFRSLESQNVIPARIVSTQLRAEDLLRFVAAEYELPYKTVSKAALLRSLEQYFRSCVEEGRRVLIVVDEAQNLPPKAIEELRMLSNFNWKGKPLLKSFLLGQREFRQIMRSEGFEQLRQRVIAAYHLRPLDLDETKAYIEHRLHLVGWKQDPRFAPEVFNVIHNYTNGVPRKINLLCDRILLFACLEEIHTIDSITLQAVLEDVREELWSNSSEEPDEFVEQVQAAQIEQAPSGESTEIDAEPNQPPEKEDDGARLSELERSVQQLTEALRGELSELRRSITQKSVDDSPEDK